MQSISKEKNPRHYSFVELSRPSYVTFIVREKKKLGFGPRPRVVNL